MTKPLPEIEQLPGLGEARLWPVWDRVAFIYRVESATKHPRGAYARGAYRKTKRGAINAWNSMVRKWKGES